MCQPWGTRTALLRSALPEAPGRPGCPVLRRGGQGPGGAGPGRGVLRRAPLRLLPRFPPLCGGGGFIISEVK